MKLKSIILTTLVMLILSMILTTTVGAKDINILSYKDRGIRYYPKYVKRGLVKIGKASWYGKPFHKRLTANGERYNMYNMTAAHRTYAMNTVLKITNLDTKKSVRVRINDRGPFYSSRDIDLSYGAARKLGMVDKGVGRVKIEVVSSSKRKSKRSKRVKKVAKSKKNYKVQVASFYKKSYANNFRKKHKLKNVQIIKGYTKSKKRTTYRVVVNCKTSWEAKRLIRSKKFNGAYMLS